MPTMQSQADITLESSEIPKVIKV